MSYKESRRDQAVANEYLANYLPCRKCGQQTEHETLMTYGEQCGRCFGAYLSETTPASVPRTLEQKRAIAERAKSVLGGVRRGDAQAVAIRLRQLEASGMRLTDSQKWVLKCCEGKAA